MKPPVSNWLRAIAALALLAALTGCGQGKVYSLSPDAARAALVGSTIPDIAFGKSAHSGPGEATAEGVVWTVVLGPGEEGPPADAGDGDEVMKLAARLAPASGGVEVSVDIDPPSGGDPKALAKAVSQRPLMFRYFRTVAREQVDAVLRRRAFSFGAVSGDLAVAVLSSLPEIRKRLAEDAAADDRKESETINHAYDAAEHGSR